MDNLMDSLMYANYMLKASKADMLMDTIISIIHKEHPKYSQGQCLLFAKFHHLITDDEWDLIKEFYG